VGDRPGIRAGAGAVDSVKAPGVPAGLRASTTAPAGRASEFRLAQPALAAAQTALARRATPSPCAPPGEPHLGLADIDGARKRWIDAREVVDAHEPGTEAEGKLVTESNLSLRACAPDNRRSGRQAQLWDALFGCDRSGRSVHGARGLAWLCRCAGASHRLTRPGESKGPPETPGWFTTAGWPRSVGSKIGSWTHSAVRTTCLSAKRNSQGMSLTPWSTGTSVGGPRVSCSRPRRIRQVPAALMFRYQSD